MVILSVSVCAQQTAPAIAPIKPTNPAAQKEIDPEILQRRSVALSLLTSLAIEARSYQDETLRARVQARVADALWDQDQETARDLFRRAWEVAEKVETQTTDGTLGVGRLAKAPPVRSRTTLRSEILKLAARRDHALGEEFLAKLAAAKKDDAQKANSSNSNSSSELSPQEVGERLRLAEEFLRAGELDRALQFADPALSQVTRGTVQFLVSLRALNATAADQRFAAMLSRAAVDPAADANTASLLTTYAFTPAFFLAVSPSGIPSSMYSAPLPAPDLSPALRANYFRVAANLLLRPFNQIDQSSAGRQGTYFIATRLLPLFQQFAPDLAGVISAQLAALGPEASATTQHGADWLNQGMGPPAGDEIGDELKDRLSRAKGSDARDRIYAMAAMRAADLGDVRAREFVDKIEDLETRNGVRSFVDYNLSMGLLGKKRVEDALALARKADLSHVLRAHVLTRGAALMAAKDGTGAQQVIEEALAETRRIDAGTPERAYSLLALLAPLSKLNKVRAWELLAEMVAAANGVKDFTGENGQTSVTLEGKVGIQLGAQLVSPTDLSDLFGELGEADFYQAMDAGKTFKGDAARAAATMAVARATLESKAGKPPPRGGGVARP